MKRNILLLFVLIGLVTLEYGCDDKPKPCSFSDSEIVGVDSVQTMTIDSSGNLVQHIKDTLSYSNLIYKVSFKSQLISKIYYGQNTLYATSPCPVPSARWFVKNISVTDTEGTYTSEWEVAAKHYNSFQNVDSIRGDEFRDVPTGMYLRPIAAPKNVGTYSFTIRIETNDGEVFETTTDPIIITS